jgi:hypothetical protein
MHAKRHIAKRLPHPQYPIEEERLPQAHLAPHGQHGAVSRGHCHLMPRTLPQLHKGWGEAQELLSGRRQRCPAFVPNEQRTPKLLFQEPDPRTHCRLGDVEPFRSPDEASV